MTARRATMEISFQARPAIINELTNLTKKGVLTGRLWEDLTPNQRKRILRSHTNVTHKHAPTSDGPGRTLDKVKVHHVANGGGQDRNHYTREETSSPTVSISGLDLSLMTTMHSHKPECVCVTADVGCAYLNAKMPKNDLTKLVHIKIEPDIATMLIEVDTTMIPYVRKNGSIIAELNKALYGCIESAVFWYEELSHTRMSLGLKKNNAGPCIFDLFSKRTLTIADYVDDLMILSNSARTSDCLPEELA